MAAFIARVKAEGFPSPDFSKFKPFPDDRYRYLTPKLVKFTTPVHQGGVGTGILVPSGDPVRGVVSLSPEMVAIPISFNSTFVSPHPTIN